MNTDGGLYSVSSGPLPVGSMGLLIAVVCGQEREQEEGSKEEPTKD